MEQENKVYTVLAVVVVVALLLSCVAGAVAGTMTGYLVARRQARLAVEQFAASGSSGVPGFHGFPEFGHHEETPFLLPEPDGDGPMPFGELPPELQGAFIRDVVPGAPAEEAGLEVDDVIIAVDRTPIDGLHPLQEVIERYRPGDVVTIFYWRAGEEGRVRVKLAQHPEEPGKAYLGVYFDSMSFPGSDLPDD